MSPDTPHDSDTPAQADPTSPKGDAERLLEVGLSGTGAPAAGRTSPPAPETLAAQFPQFEILEVLGQGGMGVVYKARQRKLDRLVALKVLPRELGEDPAFTARFAREGRTLAKLQHPHIVGVHDFGEADGQSYLVMEYVDGVNLRALMESGELTPREALTIVPQICDALQYAHDEGVVHRDIKPENVLLDRSGSVKVADFGLAKMAERGPGDFTLTGTDQVMGTLHYMAPEQYRTPQDVDHRADIFSLGVVFYEMLTGDLPVGRFEEPSKSGTLDARIDEIVMRTLERERDQRYQHARDVSTAVSSMRDAPPPTSGWEKDVAGALQEVVSEVETAARSLWDKRPGRAKREASEDETPDGGRRRWSRWALTSLILLLLTPAFGGIAYGLVSEFVPFPNNHVHDDVAAWIVTLSGLGLTGIFAIVAIAVTQTFRKRVRGQFLSIGVLVVCLVGIVIGFIMLDKEVRDMIEWKRFYREQGYFGGDAPRPDRLTIPGPDDPEPPREIIVDMVAGNARETATIQRDIQRTLATFGDVVRMEGARVEELVVRHLYDAEDLETLQDLSGDADDEKRASGAFGLGMLARSPVLAYWDYLHLDFIRIEGDRATVRMSADTVGKSGTRMVTGKPPLRSVTFPMKRTSYGWVFDIGPVRVR